MTHAAPSPEQPASPLAGAGEVNDAEARPETVAGHWLGGLLIGAIATAVFVVYWATAAPGAWWGDGLELACAAKVLGIPHPTGYPLYMLTGHAAIVIGEWLGAASAGRALTLFSALLLAVACGLLIVVYRRVIEGVGFRTTANPGAVGTPVPTAGTQARVTTQADLANAHSLLPAAGVALLIDFATTVWQHATFTEVYPLTFFLASAVLALVWPQSADRKPSPGRAAALGLLFGLALGNHYSILAMGPLVTFCVLGWARGSGRPLRTLMAAGAGLSLGLLVYLYLPIRAAANPPFNWGDPRTLKNFLWMLSGGQFREVNIGSRSAWQGLVHWIAWWGNQWLPQRQGGDLLRIGAGGLTLGLAIVGLVRLATRRRDLGWGLLGALTVTGFFAALYHIPDIDPYFMVALPAAGVGWIVEVQWLLARVRRRYPRMLSQTLGGALSPLAALGLLLIHYPTIDKSWDDGPEVWGGTVMKALPEGALVITGGDADIYALWYQQMALGMRPDVTIFGSNFIFQGWYARYFEAAGRPRIPLQLEARRLAETNETIFYSALLKGVILPNFARGGRIYATFLNPLFVEYFTPTVVTELYPPGYLAAATYPYLPPPQLYELQSNRGLGALNAGELARELEAFQARRQGATLHRNGIEQTFPYRQPGS